MGLYWRKSTKILPGVRINWSKNGPSISIGPRGAKLSIGKRGTYVSGGIAGTGMYYRKKISGNSSNMNSHRWDDSISNEINNNGDSSTSAKGCIGCLSVLAFFALLALISTKSLAALICFIVLVGSIFIVRFLNSQGTKESVINQEKEKGEQTQYSLETYEKKEPQYSKYKDDNEPLKVFLKIILPIIGLMAIFYLGITYFYSRGSIAAYEQQISMAKSYEEQSNYGEAIAEYWSAAKNYDGNFLPSTYKKKAKKLANDSFEKTKLLVDQAISKKNYREALFLLSTMPSDYLAQSKSSEEWIENAKYKMENSVNDDIIQLAQMISKAGGKLDPKAMEFLDELLAVSPDNYWLLNLKNKKK